MCEIASNQRIETSEVYDINQNTIIKFTRRFNKNEVTLYYLKFDPDFAC